MVKPPRIAVWREFRLPRPVRGVIFVEGPAWRGSIRPEIEAMVNTLPPVEPNPSYLVLIGKAGDLDWLGQFDSWPEAETAMTDWLGRDDRDDEDAAFVLSVIAWGRAEPQADPALPGS